MEQFRVGVQFSGGTVDWKDALCWLVCTGSLVAVVAEGIIAVASVLLKPRTLTFLVGEQQI